MLKGLVDFYDNSPDVQPVGHVVRTPDLALEVSSSTGKVSVTPNTRPYVYPKPPRTGLTSNPALACDQIKYVTGFTGKEKDKEGRLLRYPSPPRESVPADEGIVADQIERAFPPVGSSASQWPLFIPEADTWATNKYHRDYFTRLRDHARSLPAPASDVLRTLLNALTPHVREALIEASEHTHNAYMVAIVDGEPLLQPAQPSDAEPTEVQRQIQEANAQLKLGEMSTGNEVREPVEGVCSVCGDVREIAAKHSKYKGKSLINADEPAYRSHGHKQSVTTSICVSCAVKYPAALETLDDRPGDHVVTSRSGETDLQWFFFSPNVPDESMGLFTSVIEGQVAEQEARRAFTALRQGKRLPEVGEVSIVAIGNTTQRMAFRYAQTQEANVLADSLTRWLGRQGERPIGVSEHCRNLSPSVSSNGDDDDGGSNTSHSQLQGDLSKVPEATYDAVIRSAIRGRALPLYLLKPLLGRLANAHAETRSYQLEHAVPTIRLAVPMDEESTAFNLGKLLSLSDYVYWLVDDKGLQMSQRYYTSLSTQPQRSFGLLCRDVRTRLTQLLNKSREDLEKSDEQTRKAKWVDQEITALIDGVGEVPRSLSSEQQAQFALGYHRARQERFNQGDGPPENGEDDD